jgi:hypothetical protein
VRHAPEREVVEVELVGRERPVHGDDAPALELHEIVVATLAVSPQLTLALLLCH